MRCSARPAAAACRSRLTFWSSTFLEEKARFVEHPYWTTEFVGTGPFALRAWVTGSHAVLAANERFVLGRPKVDAVEVKFIPDPNTLVANIVAGTVDITLGRALSLEPSLQVRDRWRDGHMELRYISWIVIYLPTHR
jgi:ABC-type transport system substrate-binding protein